MTTMKTAPATALSTTTDDGAGGSEPSPHMGAGVTPVNKTDLNQNDKQNHLAAGQHTLRPPSRHDGYAIQQLISQCPPLDLNSVYTYLLMGEHFTRTCVVAEAPEGIDGFISAYVHPEKHDTLFVWQVAVHERARGLGLGRRMLQALLQRSGLQRIKNIETTVGPDNRASRGMFSSLARALDTTISEQALFDAQLFGPQSHEDEQLLRIGPF